MTDSEIEQFNSEHPAATASYFEKVEDTGSGNIFRNADGLSNVCAPIVLPESLSKFGNGMDSKTIMHASKQELLEAVKKGTLSKARFRIEMHRRENKEYYSTLSEVDEIKI